MRSVAEHAITLMMALSKNLIEGDVQQREGNWKIRDAKKSFEIENKTALIIGLGNIGKIIAHLCQGLDMKVIAYDSFLTREQMATLNVIKYDDKMEALQAADVVFVQMPLIEGITNNTIAKEELKMHTDCVEGCLAVLRGEKWPYVADKAVYNHPCWQKK